MCCLKFSDWGRYMVRIAVVEDEEIYRNQITEYLQRYEEESGEILQISVYRDGDDILRAYRAQFDIVLMDIQLKFVDRMTAAEEIRRQDAEVILIFITNMTQYAIQGYQVDAMDYVLKPVSYFSFSQKLSKALDKLHKRHSRHITVQVKGGVQRIAATDIYYVESEGHTLRYHTKNGIIVSSGTMKSAEEMLGKSHFSRGNKGYLINLEHVEGVKDKCAQINGEHLLLSRQGMKKFMQDLTRYWGEME